MSGKVEADVMEHLLDTAPPFLEDTAEVMRLKEQVRELRVELEAKESQNQELMAIAEHVRAQEDARKHAEELRRFCSELHFLDVWTGDVFYEEKLKMAQQAAQADAAEKDRRYAELFHMVCQVDREVAARRTAEQRLEPGEPRERAQVAEEAQLQLQARLSEKEAQLVPLRSQLAKASAAASEHRILNNSLQEQLELVVKTSEARAASCAEAKAKLQRAEQQTDFARKEAELLDYAELQKAYDEAGGALCERFGEANRNKEIVDTLRGDLEALEKELDEVHEQLKAAKADTADWCERAMVAADQLATGQGKAAGRWSGRWDVGFVAVSTFLRKFPAAPAVLVLFKHLLSQAAETLEASVKQRLFLHGQYLSRHELNQHVELNVVSQALFGALDLEREGQIPQDLLLERLREPPSMKEVWLADLESLWPGRESIVECAAEWRTYAAHADAAHAAM
eukprot:g16438.t1